MVADTALEQNEFGGTLQGDPKGSSAGKEAGLWTRILKLEASAKQVLVGDTPDRNGY